MSTKLIWNPDVFVVGSTVFDTEGFESWIKFNGHESLMLDDVSPLSQLWKDVDDDFALERMIEFGGRHCYRAWKAGRNRFDYIRNIIEMNHGSVLEHSTINLAIQGVSRSLSLELVRHRVGVAISQESQRYVSADDMKFVVPPLVMHLTGAPYSNAPALALFEAACRESLNQYLTLQNNITEEIKRTTPNIKSLTMIKKRANEAARAHLPNACETRLLWTPNMRLLRHFLWLRGGEAADLEIRRLAVELLGVAQSRAPAIFADMTTAEGSYGVPVIVAVQ